MTHRCVQLKATVLIGIRHFLVRELVTILLVSHYFVIIVQAILDLDANADDAAALENGELRTTSWSGLDIDKIHISTHTYNRMEREIQRACYKGLAPYRVVIITKKRSCALCSTSRATMCYIFAPVGTSQLTGTLPPNTVGLVTMTRNLQLCRSTLLTGMLDAVL